VIRAAGVEAWKCGRGAVEHGDGYLLLGQVSPRPLNAEAFHKTRVCFSYLRRGCGVHAQETIAELQEEANQFNLLHEIAEFTAPPLPADFNPGRKHLTAQDVFVLRKYGRAGLEAGGGYQITEEFLRLSDAARLGLREEAEAINRWDIRPRCRCRPAIQNRAWLHAGVIQHFFTDGHP
jgi:hypothetical protein